MNSPCTIHDLKGLRHLLFDLLCYRKTLKEEERIIQVPSENGIIGTLATFLIVLQEAKAPLINGILVAAVLEVLKFLPIDEVFVREIEQACNDLSELCAKESRPIRKSDNPVAYFFMRGVHLPGFPFLALASRDLILRHRKRDGMIPALLAACSTVPNGIRHYNLRPEDIISPQKYSKKDGNRLSLSSQENYKPIQKALLENVRKIYLCLGYGSPTLLLEPEGIEIAREKDYKKRSSFSMSQFPHISEFTVLKPQYILHLLTYGPAWRDIKIRDFRDFNFQSLMTIPTMIFTYGSEVENLLSFRISNLERDKKRIKYNIKNPDSLLQETTGYIPLHAAILDTLDSLLRYRMSKHPVAPDEPLFVTQSGEGFYPLDIHDIERFFKRLSARYGKDINDTSLYFSHLAYYLDIGDLNPIISDRISKRMESIVYIPRLYCASYLRDIRAKHHSAFVKVSRTLGITVSSITTPVPDEHGIVLGGKRAPGKQVISAVFDFFAARRPFDFQTATRWQCFLHNYCVASRVSEITSMTDRSIDLVLQVAKIKVKNTVTRKDTTKVVPLTPFMLTETQQYLSQRELLLREIGQRPFKYILFRASGRELIPLDTNHINESYHAISVMQGVDAFTSHCVRYQAESDFTERGLSFEHTNAILAHYTHGDLIFSEFSDVSFPEFRRQYHNTMDDILREYM